MRQYITQNTPTKPYVVSFFGHDEVISPQYIIYKIRKLIHRIIRINEHTIFIIKPDMRFDGLAYYAIRMERRYLDLGYSEIIEIPPYKKHRFTPDTNFKPKPRDKNCCRKEYRFPRGLSADEVRCRSIVDRSDMIICYIDDVEDIAYSSVLYAYNHKHKRKFVNLADDKLLKMDIH